MTRRMMAGAVLVPALAAGAGVALAEPAGADGPNGIGDPLHGDLNGDGHTDIAVLSSGPTGCNVTVQLGDGFTSYGPPTTYTYPDPDPGFGYCPDMGVIVDLGGDGVSELVLAWWAGHPPGVADDLLVLENFVPVGGFDAIYMPQFIGTADFNGDGLIDVYESTDQGASFITYLNTPTGELVPGPMAFSGYSDEYHFADFDEDGATDVAFGFIEGFNPGGPSMGVAVLLDDGTVTYLESADTDYGWGAIVTDVNHDGHTDVRSINNDTGVVRTFLNNGAGVFTLAK